MPFITRASFADSTFAGETFRPHVRYEYDDVDGENWTVVCPSCSGNGYDIETEGFSVCDSCEGLGEFGPMSTAEVREHFRI